MTTRKTAAPAPRRELTIGALAKRARVAPSVLRYYEKEGLLRPGLRTAAGYRLYGPEAERTLLFINRAKRLGFSLDDIRQFLAAEQPAAKPGQKKVAKGKAPRNSDVTRIAEDRFLEIERRLTELLVLRHELEVFLREMSGQLPAEDGARELYRRLVDQVCGHQSTPRTEAASLRSLMKRMGCALAAWDRGEVLDVLRGRHIHVWRETDGYSVLIPGDDAQIGVALQQIAASEAGCSAHTEPRVEHTDEGYVFSAHGDNAFLFAQFFLALEHRAAA